MIIWEALLHSSQASSTFVQFSAGCSEWPQHASCLSDHKETLSYGWLPGWPCWTVGLSVLCDTKSKSSYQIMSLPEMQKAVTALHIFVKTWHCHLGAFLFDGYEVYFTMELFCFSPSNGEVQYLFYQEENSLTILHRDGRSWKRNSTSVCPGTRILQS